MNIGIRQTDRQTHFYDRKKETYVPEREAGTRQTDIHVQKSEREGDRYA